MSEPPASESKDSEPSTPVEVVVPGEASPAEPRMRATGATRASSVLAALAAALAAVALVAAGVLWWQQGRIADTLEEIRRDAVTALERGSAESRVVSERLAALDAALVEQRANLAQLRQWLEALPARLAALEQQVDAAQDGSVDARARWLRAEAEHYLALANAELALASNWENAVLALELADERLRRLADPAFGRVRELIAQELLELRGVRLPDVEGLVFSLGRLAARVAELPMRAEAPIEVAQPAQRLDDVEPGLTRLWLSLRQALRGIVSIERRDEPVAPLLPPDQRELVRRQTALALDLARAAAVRGQSDAYATALRSAHQLLVREFDTDTPAVEGALALITQLLEVDVAPEQPDISGSLARLRGLSAGGN